jgi:hypothetical protein
VGQGRASFWWGCANRSTVIRRFKVSKASCRDRSPTRTSVCLTHPTGCANRSTVIRRFKVSKASCRERKPHQNIGLLDPPYRLGPPVGVG